jgi:hypothetical protein
MNFIHFMTKKRRVSMNVKHVICTLILGGFSCFSTGVLANVGGESVSIMIEQPLHVLGVDGSDALIAPGSYSVEAADTWLRLIPGERRDAILLEAEGVAHQEAIAEPVASLNSLDEDLQEIILLLPNGTGLKALGTYSGVLSRGVSPGKQRNRLALRAPVVSSQKAKPRAQNQNPRVMTKKKAGGLLTPEDPWDRTLLDLILKMEKEIKGLKSKVAKLTNHHHDYQRTRTGVGGREWVRISQLRRMQDDESAHNDDWGVYFRTKPNTTYPANQTSEPKH